MELRTLPTKLETKDHKPVLLWVQNCFGLVQNTLGFTKTFWTWLKYLKYKIQDSKSNVQYYLCWHRVGGQVKKSNQKCRKTRKFVRNPKLLIARSTIQPYLSKIKNHGKMHPNSLKNGKLFLILLNDGWMVDLAMGSFGFLTIFLIFWHPWDPWICIRSVCCKWNLKQIEAIPPSVSKNCHFSDHQFGDQQQSQKQNLFFQ